MDSLPEIQPADESEAPYQPTPEEWAEFCAWSREMEARREILDDLERESIEAECGNRTPADD